MTKSDKIEWFLHDGEREIGPLSEVELRKRLRRGSREKMRVRQNDGPWHPAKEVVRKFRHLAENGIYIKLESVAGPYTAAKAFAILKRLSLDGVQAKIGLHGSWVPAAMLLEKLQNAIDKANQPPIAEDAHPRDEEDDSQMLEVIDGDDDGIVTLDPIDGVEDVFGLSDSGRFELEDKPIPIQPLEEIEEIPTVEPVFEDTVPTVEPIAQETIPYVQPIEQPVVEPIPVVTPQPNRAPVHLCACGREVRVMPQHIGMTMQCPACKRTFVAR